MAIIDEEEANYYQQKQLSCIDVFWYGFYVVCGIVLGRHMASKYGWLPGVICGLIGVILSWGLLQILVRLLPENAPNDTEPPEKQ